MPNERKESWEKQKEKKYKHREIKDDEDNDYEKEIRELLYKTQTNFDGN